MFAVTESWHLASDDVPVLRATPFGFSSRDRPRPPHPDGRSARGGGIIVFFRSSLRVSQIALDDSLTTLEALCLSIATPHGPITLLTVYRPGSSPPTAQFFEELSTIFETIVTRNSQLIILGDFNIHLEEPTLPNSVRFLDLLTQFGLRQHINESTHLLGGYLDLVITGEDDQVDDLKILPPTLSDHSVITFTLPFIHLQPIHSIRMIRGWKSFDSCAFSAALRDTLLSSLDPTLDVLSVAQLFDLYTSTVTNLLDAMLPRRKVWTRQRPLAVWYDADCHRLRRRTRYLERRYRRTKKPDDRLAWINQLRSLHRLYHQKEADHWEKLVLRNEKTLDACGHRSRVSSVVLLVRLKLHPSLQMNFKKCLQPRLTDFALRLLMLLHRHSHRRLLSSIASVLSRNRTFV